MTERQQRVPVSHVDATWLGMDESTNLMIINCVMLFDKQIDFDRLSETMRERLVEKFDRFSQRVIEAPPGIGRLYWEADPHFDIRSHIHHLALPAPGDDAALQGFIGQLMSEPLDRSRPLWRAYLIDNYGDGCSLYSRMHHAIGDGIALMRVLLSMTDPEPRIRADREPVVTGAGTTGSTPGLLRTTFRMAERATGAMISVARAANSDPERAKETAREAVSMLKATGIVAAATSVNLAKLVLMSKDRESVYRGALTPVKRIAWSKPIELERVTEIGTVTGATVNDILVACVAGGLRRYATAVDGQAPKRDIRATVPVNLRPPDAPLTLGNKFSLVYLALPISISDPYQRLYEVKRRMDALKRSPEPLLVYEILNVLGMIPGPVSRRASTWFASKATCVLTNVPGPREPVYLAGRRADRLMFWAPQSRGVGMGISIVSYAGEVTIGLMADEALVPEPARVVDEFHAEFDDLGRVAASFASDSSRDGPSGSPPVDQREAAVNGAGEPAEDGTQCERSCQDRI